MVLIKLLRSGFSGPEVEEETINFLVFLRFSSLKFMVDKALKE
jgi:hypothetical protein